MKTATFVNAVYQPSDTVTLQGTRNSINRYIKQGYNIKESRNGYWVLTKPASVCVHLKNSDNIIFSFDMKSDILNYYGKIKISINLVNKFVSDVSSGKIQFYMDDDNSYYFK